MILGSSFTAEEVIRTEGVQLIPKQFTLAAYEMVCKGGGIWKSYLLTIILTVVGTAVGLTIIAMTGYALQRKDFPFRNGISFYIYFTSLFSAGLAPYYLLMTQTYHLKDSYFAVLLPLMMSPWLIIMMKNFVKAIPHEITESGKIDGAGDMKIFVSLILPMLKPALATIGLFLALGYWNEWYQSSLFLSSKVDVKPLQYTLYEVVNKMDQQGMDHDALLADPLQDSIYHWQIFRQRESRWQMRFLQPDRSFSCIHSFRNILSAVLPLEP